MSKTYSKAAKRRAKAAMPDLAPTPKREKSGRKQRPTTQSERNADKPALESRARMMGLPADSAKDMRRPRLSEPPGIAIDLSCGADEATRLWGHYIALTASEARYHRTNGLSLHAKTAKIEMEPETFETRADDAIDLRTEDERTRDAIRSWSRWCEIMECLPLRARSAITTAKRDLAPMVDAGKPTPAGTRFVKAMQQLDALM